MTRDILSEYGPDADKPQAPRASRGGVTKARDVMNYKPPQGPIGIMRPGAPGLGGHNCGPCGSQGASSLYGDGGAGSPGLGGDNEGKGANRG